MTSYADFGKEGEGLAADWLAEKGYEILHRNWRHGRYEVDIIACCEGVYHFIEVKARHSSTFGHPEEKVSKSKLKNMMQGAVAWLCQFPGPKRVQYDVLAITLRKNEGPEYFLIEDVYL